MESFANLLAQASDTRQPLQCKDCRAVVPRRGGRQLYCDACSLKRQRARQKVANDRNNPRHNRARSARQQTIWFIDGEGQGRFPHVYTFLAAVSEEGEHKQTRFAPDGLSSIECLDFLASLPTNRCFGYSLGYDWTMILTDLALTHPKKAWELVHEESREYTDAEGKTRHKFVRFGPYALHSLNGQWTLATDFDPSKGRHTRRLQIWDVFRFFQSRFTKALEDWKVSTKDKLDRMYTMKAARGSLENHAPSEVMAYCREECAYGAKLVRELIDRHEEAGLPLRDFHGPGATARTMLRSWNVKDYLRPDEDHDPALRHAISCAYFGGRFEPSCIGPIREPVHEDDIASAYPYAITFLPCLVCGRWRHVKGRGLQKAIESATLACVRAIPRETDRDYAWGALPWRARDGTIVFPTIGGPTWVWKPEYLAALKVQDNIEATEAWVYHTDCDHRPFARMPEFYLERLKWGKEGPGQPLKLGSNASYGVMLVRKGARTFRSLIWGGNVTAQTRAMLLEVLATMRDPWSLVMMATDAVYTLAPPKLPKPRDTGTLEGAKAKDKPPLGGWEHKVHERGMFLMRSGIYFPLSPTEADAKECRARGMGRALLLKHADRIVQHWETHFNGSDVPPPYKVTCAKGETPMTRFVGLKGSFVQKKGAIARRTEGGRELYGEWIPYEPELSYDPMPKRSRIMAGSNRLQPHCLVGMQESTPYDLDLCPPERLAEEALADVAEDQPDGDVYVPGF